MGKIIERVRARQQEVERKRAIEEHLRLLVEWQERQDRMREEMYERRTAAWMSH